MTSTTMVVLAGRIACALLLMAAWAVAGAALADQVVPRETVTNHVNVRQSPSTEAARIGILPPNERLEFIKSIGRWHVVRLSDGRRGFVSKSLNNRRSGRKRIAPLTVASGTFSVHFLDVGTGDSAIIDIGDKEIVIDGGNSTTVLELH